MNITYINEGKVNSIDTNRALKMITQGNHMIETIENIREIAKAGGKTANLKQEMLSSFIFGGEFSSGKRTIPTVDDLIAPSGLVYLDFDFSVKEKSKASKTKEAVAADPFIAAVWTSVGGGGLGALARAKISTKEDYTNVYKNLINYYKNKGITLDPACSNINRRTFITYDPDAFIRYELFDEDIEDENMYIVEINDKDTKIAISQYSGHHRQISEKFDYEKFYTSVIEHFSQNGPSITPKYQHSVILALGMIAIYKENDKKQNKSNDIESLYNETLSDYLRISKLFEGYNENSLKNRFRDLWSLDTDKIGVGSLIYLARELGWKADGEMISGINIIHVLNEYFEVSIGTNPRREIVPKLYQRDVADLSRTYGKEVLEMATMYQDFANEPCNIKSKYERELLVGGKMFYNIYPEPAKEAKQGDCYTILGFIKHIFGEKYELGLDYLQILYTMPKHPLPVLVLVSKEQGTGKSMFTNLLKALLGNCVTKIGSNDVKQDFNDFVKSLVVVFEEFTNGDKDFYNIIKKYSTEQSSVRVNEKFQRPYEVYVYLKFVMTSNDEDDFLKICINDSRFCVLKVPIPPHKNPSLNDVIIDEIPAFMYFLENRQIKNPRRDRLWFTPEQFDSEAKQKVIEVTEDRMSARIKEFLIKAFEQNPNEKEIAMPAKDIGDAVCKYFKMKSVYSSSAMKPAIMQLPNTRISKLVKVPTVTVSDDLKTISIDKEVKKPATPFIFKREDYSEPELAKLDEETCAYYAPKLEEFIKIDNANLGRSFLAKERLFEIVKQFGNQEDTTFSEMQVKTILDYLCKKGSVTYIEEGYKINNTDNEKFKILDDKVEEVYGKIVNKFNGILVTCEDLKNIVDSSNILSNDLDYILKRLKSSNRIMDFSYNSHGDLHLSYPLPY